MTSPIFELVGLRKDFGGLTAVDDLDLVVNPGEIFGLIGPNGSGKTTVYNVVSGVHRPTRGKSFFEGKEVTGLRPDKIAEKGIVRTFQIASLFKERSVLDNVMVAFHLQSRAGFWRSMLNSRYSRNEEKRFRERALEILSFMGIESLKDEHAINLPHGHQVTLGLAIALAANPRLLLLDEPMTGMSSEEVSAMVSRIKRINEEQGITVMVVEHNMRAVMELCHRITVINFGKKIAEGTPDEIRRNPAVIEAYLGES
ncbi:MAG: ABC transporter ATP-binding protein [Pseudomonadota bacterium]